MLYILKTVNTVFVQLTRQLLQRTFATKSCATSTSSTWSFGNCQSNSISRPPHRLLGAYPYLLRLTPTNLPFSTMSQAASPARSTAAAAPTASASSSSSDSPSGLAHTNRLADEKSPYLRQHMHNPVDWYPWGEDAFRAAREQNKPIFLSVGYSTCHWCHVMEHESFESQVVADVMNKHYINIKVDREERPDVDKVYMTFIQAAGHGGGWPMSVWLTPSLEPFHGGTYFPPEDRFSRPGFRSILERIAMLWKTQHEKVALQASSITEQLKQFSTRTAASVPGPDAAGVHSTLSRTELVEIEKHCFDQLVARFDAKRGGFGSAPKFPRPVELNFLLRVYARHVVDQNTNEVAQQAWDMVRCTLQHMADGGVHDHLGGGFARYSVDEHWHVPHFEKMLYDQAQLVTVYANAYAIATTTAQEDKSQAASFRHVMQRTIQYVERVLMSPEGGIFCAEDADSLEADGSKKSEGAFYIWGKQEIETTVGDSSLSDAFCATYYIKEAGNTDLSRASDPHEEFTGQNILIKRGQTADGKAVPFDEQSVCASLGVSAAELRRRVELASSKLFEAREKRHHPHLDDKVICSWNGLMLSALCRAASVLEYSAPADDVDAVALAHRWTAMATKLASFITTKLYDEKSETLIRSYRQGRSDANGFCEDYACAVAGMLDIYELTANIHYLEWAVKLQQKQNELFWDDEAGGYFDTTGTDPSVLLRMKNDYDGAEPSATSVSTRNLLRLYDTTNDSAYHSKANQAAYSMRTQLIKAPVTIPEMCCALDMMYGPVRHVVVAGESEKALMRVIYKGYVPNQTVVYVTDESRPYLSSLHDFYSSIITKSSDAGCTVYVCENMACNLPCTDAESLEKLLAAE
jgi:uncharacterized protein YyaL (SSP411 family)